MVLPKEDETHINGDEGEEEDEEEEEEDEEEEDEEEEEEEYKNIFFKSAENFRDG